MTWSTQEERGCAWLTRAAMWLALRGAGPVLGVIGTGWFLLTCRSARLASRDYLRRVLLRPVGTLDVARHFHSFACAVVHRVMLLAGRHAGFKIRTEGIGAVLDVLAEGRGCILLGAHLGSFEVLRTVAAQAPVPVWALMYRRNGGALTSLLDRLAPGLNDRVLEIGDTASMIRVRECVERGEIVGILADRAPVGRGVAEQRMVAVPFLGAAAAFPSGPFVLASMLGAPVVMFHAVRTGPQAYDVVFAPFADRVVLRRGSRAEDLRGVIGRYAAAVERLCRAYPYQWFNFYAFWEGGLDEGVEAVAAVGAPAIVAGSRG